MTLVEPARAVRRHVGSSLRRLEDRPLLTGAARFTDDVLVPGLLHAAVVRSPVAHGRVRGVDRSAVPGSVDVLSADDLAAGTDPQPIQWVLPGQWQTERALFDGTVRYVGDPVGVVVAADRYRAADALERVVVDIEELPAVVGIDAALADTTTPLYPPHESNVLATLTRGDDDDLTGAVFAAAEHTLALDLELGRVAAVAIEPRGIVVDPGPPGADGRPEKLTIWTSTQAPHAVRDTVAAVCRLPQHRVRVLAPEVGGAFGAKDHIYDDELLVVLAALRLGRPLKWIEDRSESLTTTTQARGEQCTVEVAYDADGTLRGMRIDAVRDCGAHLSMFGAGPLFAFTGNVEGPYRWDAVSARGRAVATSTCPTHSYRGFGQTQATFVRELAVDAVAAHLAVDPFELRVRNCIPPEAQPYRRRTGLSYDGGDYAESVRCARALVDAWPAPPDDGRRWGTAAALYVQQAGIGPSQGNPHIGLRIGSWESTTLRMEPDGSVRAFVGVSSHGQGHATTFAQLIADRLGTSPAMVEVIQSDTDVTPYSAYGTAASRSIAVGGGSAVLAAERLEARIVAIAAHLLEAAPDDIVLDAGAAMVRGTPGRRLPLAVVAERAWQGWDLPPGHQAGLVEHAVYDPTEFTWSYATHACRVAVDADTGLVSVDRYAVVLDCGTVVNPMIVAGQVHGGVAQGLGPALLEEVVIDDSGQPRTTTLLDYLVPTAATVPPIELALLDTPSPHTPGGMKGMGEGGTNGGFSCVANAVRAALPEAAHRLTRTPYTPQRIWAALHPSSNTGGVPMTERSEVHKHVDDRPARADLGHPSTRRVH